MATWDDVRRLVEALPDTDEHSSYGGHPSWRVRQKAFAWDRPLRPSDREALADAAPEEAEPVLGVRVADEGVKAALIADDPGVYFTTPHFDGYPAVLVRLVRIPADELAELVEDAWRLRAPRTLLAEFTSRSRPREHEPARERPPRAAGAPRMSPLTDPATATPARPRQPGAGVRSPILPRDDH